MDKEARTPGGTGPRGACTVALRASGRRTSYTASRMPMEVVSGIEADVVVIEARDTIS